MLEGKGSRDEQRLGPRHEEFLELCALAASGSLGEAEGRKLREHLVACSECREAMKEFDMVVDEVIPELAPELTGEPAFDPSFSQEKAEASFRKRLTEEKERERNGVEANSSVAATVMAQRGSFRRHFERYDLWLPMAASALLCATLGILSYRTGRNHGIEWARLEERNSPTAQTFSVDAHAAAQPNAKLQDTELAPRDRALADLRREITQKSGELERLKALANAQQLALRTSADDKHGVTEERDRLLRQVSVEGATLRETQERLKHLEREQSEYVIHTASLETRIAELSNSLNERERLTAEQQDLLAKDRDIRELIGARDLYEHGALAAAGLVCANRRQAESHPQRPVQEEVERIALCKTDLLSGYPHWVCMWVVRTEGWRAYADSTSGLWCGDANLPFPERSLGGGTGDRGYDEHRRGAFCAARRREKRAHESEEIDGHWNAHSGATKDAHLRTRFG
jgi:hypothetical protein